MTATRERSADSGGDSGRLRGVLPVAQLPYHEDERIDWETLRAEVEWLWGQGVNGLVMAMVTEVLRLSESERCELAERLCAWSAGRGPVIVSVGAESSWVAQERARHAEGAGASAVMAIPPVSIGVDEGELGRYYERVLSATALPAIVQDASGYVGRPMPVAFAASLQERFGDRVLFKPEATPIGPRLSALRNATGGRARVFEGTGGIALVDSYRRGIVGTMPGADLIRVVVALWSALERRDDETITRLNQALCPLLALQNSLDAFLAIEKHLLVRQSVFRNTVVRGPVGYRLDDETRELVDRLFDDLVGVLDELRPDRSSVAVSIAGDDSRP